MTARCKRGTFVCMMPRCCKHGCREQVLVVVGAAATNIQPLTIRCCSTRQLAATAAGTRESNVSPCTSNMQHLPVVHKAIAKRMHGMCCAAFCIRHMLLSAMLACANQHMQSNAITVCHSLQLHNCMQAQQPTFNPRDFKNCPTDGFTALSMADAMCGAVLSGVIGDRRRRPVAGCLLTAHAAVSGLSGCFG